MVDDALTKHLEYASKVVATWPKWKQEILGGTMVKYCDCECHEEGKFILHIVACCEGECFACGRGVAVGFKEHVEECSNQCPKCKGWNCKQIGTTDSQLAEDENGSVRETDVWKCQNNKCRKEWVVWTDTKA